MSVQNPRMAFPRDELLRLLSRETIWSVDDLRWWVDTLDALGWDAHQIRRGVMLVAGSAGRLRLENLVTMSRVVDDPDKILDALTEGPDDA